MKFEKLDLQSFLSLGYLYLLVVGILTDTVFYSYAGINILSYSSLLDVLLSPIVYMTKNPLIPVFVFLPVLVLPLWNTTLVPWLRKKKPGKEPQLLAPGKMVLICAMFVIGLYLGLGFGKGAKLKEQITDNTLKPDHELRLDDHETLRVKLIGQNSLYLFYIPEGSTRVVITPVGNSIFQISKL